MIRQPVVVAWHDAHAGHETWLSIDDAHKDTEPYVVHSCGFLLTESTGGKPNHLSIAQSWSEDDALDSILHIPVAMVQTVTYLKGKRRADKRTKRSDHPLSEPSRTKRQRRAE